VGDLKKQEVVDKVATRQWGGFGFDPIAGAQERFEVEGGEVREAPCTGVGGANATIAPKLAS